MLETLWRTCAWLLIGQGGVHTLVTVPFYGQLTPEAVWFAGTGLMMVFLGLLNLIARRTADPGARRLCHGRPAGPPVRRALCARRPEPQAFAGLGLLFGLAVGALAQVPQNERAGKTPR